MLEVPCRGVTQGLHLAGRFAGRRVAQPLRLVEGDADSDCLLPFVVGGDGAAACDAAGCAAEESEADGLAAVWADDLGTAVAVGDGVVAVRRAKSRR
jgi:hypothetical protein